MPTEITLSNEHPINWQIFKSSQYILCEDFLLDSKLQHILSPNTVKSVSIRRPLYFSFVTDTWAEGWWMHQQFSSVAQSCLTLCDPMNRSTPGLPVHHQLPEFTQTHIHPVSDAIQPSHPLLSPSPAPNPSQHQSLFQ